MKATACAPVEQRCAKAAGAGWRVAGQVINRRLNAAVAVEPDALPYDMRARLSRLGEIIETFGLGHLGMPHDRQLEDPLWEVRLNGRDGIARAIYVTASGRRAVSVHAFVKKTQQTRAVR